MYSTEMPGIFAKPDQMLFSLVHGAAFKPLKHFGYWQYLQTLTDINELLEAEPSLEFHPGDSILPANFIFTVGDDTYLYCTLYRRDSSLAPEDQQLTAVLKNPVDADWSMIDPARDYDMYKPRLLEAINNNIQTFVNLAAACDKIVSIVSTIVPVRNYSFPYRTLQTEVDKHRSEILKVLSQDLVIKLESLCLNFISMESWDKNLFPNLTIVKREIPAGSESIYQSFMVFMQGLAAIIPYYSDGFKWGGSLAEYAGPVSAVKYTNPESFNMPFYDWFGATENYLARSEKILNELNLIETPISNPVTDIDNPEGYLQPDDPYYKDPLSDDELEQKKNEQTGNEETEEKETGTEEKTQTESTTGKKIAVAATIFTILKLLF